MPERNSSPDKVASPELVKFHEGLIGLQARMLIGGEALNPTKLDLPAVTKDALGKIETRNYSPFVAASMRERRQVTKTKQESINDFVALIENSKSFFKDDREGKGWNELFLKLGIDTQNFTAQQAETFYNKYFYQEKSQSNIKQFIQDTVAVYKKPDGKIDYQKLKQNLEGVQWLANLFGKISSEIISQLVDAEVKLQTQPDTFIQQANETKDNTLRVNNLLPKEKELLAFLHGTKPTVQPTPTQPQPAHPRRGKELPVGFDWKYQRPGDPRIFPEPHLLKNIENLTNPEFIARFIKQQNPHINEQPIIDQIKREQSDLEDFLRINHLGQPELRNILERILTDYKNFFQTKYKITLPSIELNKITIKPIWGITSKVINPHALGIVYPISPTIYLNFDQILEKASKLARKEWSAFTVNHIVRLLNEIKPHEYTHLALDLAYWYLIKKDQFGKEEEVGVQPGKIGLEVLKPTPPYLTEDLEIIMKSRGAPLMEAVTVELTRQWAGEKYQQPLDLPAYGREREVLYALINLISNEQKISFDESFRKFVLASSSAQGYWDLVQELSGRRIIRDSNGKFIRKVGSITRPNFLGIIYALMEIDERKVIEKKRQGIEPENIHFDFSLGFINNNLTPRQKQELLNIINNPPDYITLSNKAKEELRRQMS